MEVLTNIKDIYNFYSKLYTSEIDSEPDKLIAIFSKIKLGIFKSIQVEELDAPTLESEVRAAILAMKPR